MPGLSTASTFKVVALAEIDSTNAEAKRRATRAAGDGLVIWARTQTAGRGRRGRSWQSPPGNLYFSLLVRADRPVAEAVQLGFVGCLAAADAVSAFLPLTRRVSCKWPNDVLVDGRKVAGMLLESAVRADGRLDWLVIGLGINLVWFPETPDLLYSATALRQQGGEDVSPEAVLTTFLTAFSNWRRTWEEQGFAAIRAAWLARAEGLGGPMTVRLERETLEGHFLDLDSHGFLLLGGAHGVRAIAAGDVFPPMPPPLPSEDGA